MCLGIQRTTKTLKPSLPDQNQVGEGGGGREEANEPPETTCPLNLLSVFLTLFDEWAQQVVRSLVKRTQFLNSGHQKPLSLTIESTLSLKNGWISRPSFSHVQLTAKHLHAQQLHRTNLTLPTFHLAFNSHKFLANVLPPIQLHLRIKG